MDTGRAIAKGEQRSGAKGEAARRKVSEESRAVQKKRVGEEKGEKKIEESKGK